MEKDLKKKVLDKIKGIYPEFNHKDILVLFGSRATGHFSKDSDIDRKSVV